MAGIYLLARMVSIFDTTLRDGAQSEGVSFSPEDKIEILRRLDDFGIDFVEGGWPSANPKDDEFFRRAREVDLRHAKLVAFGSTRHSGTTAANDPNLSSLIDCGTEWVCIFGKSWDLHALKALNVTLEENLEMVRDSVAHLVAHGKRVIFDAEHFFDGYAHNREYAMEVLRTAAKAGADWLCLCDTNGGTMPGTMSRVVADVVNSFDVPIGVHNHNDSEVGVANSLVAVEAGALMVQGTINGMGERCGNANLCSIIPNLTLKMGQKTGTVDMSRLTSLSRFVSEMVNQVPDASLPFVGRSAFAHKAGIHISAMNRDPQTYEHLDPTLVGNQRRYLISEQAGTASVMVKLAEMGIELERERGRAILEQIKILESEGFQFEGADASFELIVRRYMGEHIPQFDLGGFRIIVESSGEALISEASVKVTDAEGVLEHTAADGDGPVNALDRALRKALESFYPEIRGVRLVDFKVRVIDGKEGTAAKVRVLIRSTDSQHTWTTVGVSTDIIEASLMALVDSLEYVLMRTRGPMDQRW